MNVLNPLRRIGATFRDFAGPHLGGTKEEFRDKVSTHLARLKLEPSVLEAYPHELSGGMRQRVTIALATICRPDFIIADEPTTALDVIVQKDVLGMIRSIQREMGSSVLFVTHDMAVHATLTDRLGVMYAGCLVEEGPTAELFASPRHPYTRHLIHSLPRIGDDRPRTGLTGSPPNLADPPPGCRFPPLPAGERPLPAGTARHDHAIARPARGLPCRRGGPLVSALLSLEQVSKTFTRGGLLSRRTIEAVKGVSFALEADKPEIFAVIGESGSGKSTLARMILGMHKPSAGSCSSRVATWRRSRQPRSPPSWPGCSRSSRTRSRPSIR